MPPGPRAMGRDPGGIFECIYVFILSAKPSGAGPPAKLDVLMN